MDMGRDKRKVVYRAGVPEPLTFDEYVAILQRAQTNRNLICTNCPLYRPEGGTIIVYDCALYPRHGMSDEQLRKTFRVDGYRWGCSKGVHRLKNGLEKRYNFLYDKNNAGGDRSFIRCEYAIDPCGLVLFHYLGDHGKAALIADSSPHGNAKNLKSPFMRTLPIVIHEIKEKARQTQASPCQIFNNLQQNNDVKSAHVVPKLLRNPEQVRNIMKIVRRQMRSSAEGRALLSMIPTSSISLYDYDNTPPHGRKLKWREGEGDGEECEGEADGESNCINQICDADKGAKRVKLEQREHDYDSDGSADTIDVINVEVNPKVQPHDEPQTIRTSLVREIGKYHLLIGVTGCAATSALHELIMQLHSRCPPNSLEIRIVVTERAVRFIADNVFDQLIYQDEDEWDLWKKPGDPLLHLELCTWADGMLIAPLSANSMAKIANGLCDNLLTSIVRAWNNSKPLFYAPAISLAMWSGPLTQQHRKTLQETLRFEELIMPEKEEIINSKRYDGIMASCESIALVIAENVRIHLADTSTDVNC